MKLMTTVLLVAAVALSAVAATPPVKEVKEGPEIPVRVELGENDPALTLLTRLGIDLDGVFDGWARAYVVAEELDKLERLGFRVSALPAEGKLGLARLASEGVASGLGAGVPALYHTYATLTADLQAIAAAYPEITRLTSIGQTVQGRELWMIQITDNPDVEEDEPGVLYISSMHGNEVVGKELFIGLIEYLASNYGTDARVTQLVDDTEIWILPSMNPDGTEAGIRWNANSADLNRDFPDQYVDPVNTTAGRQPETAAVMNWGFAHTTSLSTNFHGGALVANYPWDSNPSDSPVYTASPDDSVFVSLARTYANANAPMAANNGVSAFDDGVTNGADWYPINGGLQDWNYIWRGSFEVLVEVSQLKWPAASTLPGFWADNLESMLAYMERVHEGVRGIVTAGDTGLPLAATITVAGDPIPTPTDPEVGDFHRIMIPGEYDLEVSAPGYAVQIQPLLVEAGPAVRHDIVLQPLGIQLRPDDACADPDGVCKRWLDPGLNDLDVVLRNLGLSASSVSAELLPTGWHAPAVQPTAAYPDIATGGVQGSSAPYYEVELMSVSTAGNGLVLGSGDKVGFALRWNSSGGEGVSEPFFLPVGPASCVVAAASAVPVSVNDHTTTVAGINVVDALELDSVKVSVDIDHTYIGELRVELHSPSGRLVTLHNRSGGSANDITGTYGTGLTPFEPLSRFEGEDSQGSWQLRVRDGVTGDTGMLQSVSLELCGRPWAATPPEMRIRGAGKEDGVPRFEWWPYPGVEEYRVYRAADPSAPGNFADVTAGDGDTEATAFTDPSPGAVAYYLVTAVARDAEGPKGHFDE